MTNKLLETLHRQQIEAQTLEPQRPMIQPKTNLLLNRIELLRRMDRLQYGLYAVIRELHNQVKWIEHLPHCRICKVEMQLDVERYLGRRSPWWVNLEESPYLEKRFRSMPKEEDFNVGNYWAQAKYYREQGTADVPGENTLEFILARAKWAYRHIGKQIKTARRLLRIVKAWDFTVEQETEFEKLYEKLSVYF